jgi:diadenosine tetraphosphatase ApaH/serine/threonine PP2A family protein phosphatase
MELTFTDSNGKVEVLGNGNDLAKLQSIVSAKYKGDERIIWQSGPAGKAYNEQLPEVPCSFNLNDGASFSIG